MSERLTEDRACVDCGASLNAGEARTFTVCDACWDKAHSKAPARGRDWLEAARERCERAAPKPWVVGERDRDGTEILAKGVNQGYPDEVGTVADVMWGADAEFIAAVRTDLPCALDEIERLVRLNEAFQGQAQNLGGRLVERKTLRARVRELEAELARVEDMLATKIAAIRAAVESERERCAGIVESGCYISPVSVAAAIRRGGCTDIACADVVGPCERCGAPTTSTKRPDCGHLIFYDGCIGPRYGKACCSGCVPF